VLTEDPEVCDNQQQARADERGENTDEAEVPDFIGVKPEAPSEVHGSGQSRNERERSEGSVGGDGDVSELEEARMHC
jgi:hypothetical protein